MNNCSKYNIWWCLISCFQIKYKNIWASQTHARVILLLISYNVRVRHYVFRKNLKNYSLFLSFYFWAFMSTLNFLTHFYINCLICYKKND